MSNFPYRSTIRLASPTDRQTLLALITAKGWSVQLHDAGAQRLAVDFEKNAEWHALDCHLLPLGRGEHQLTH